MVIGGVFVDEVRRHGADLFACFERVFEKLMHKPPPGEVESLLPATWIKTRPAAPLLTLEAGIA